MLLLASGRADSATHDRFGTWAFVQAEGKQAREGAGKLVARQATIATAAPEPALFMQRGNRRLVKRGTDKGASEGSAPCHRRESLRSELGLVNQSNVRRVEPVKPRSELGLVNESNAGRVEPVKPRSELRIA